MDSLYSKARALIDRLFHRSSDFKLQEYENFIKNEIKPPAEAIYLSAQDLTEIHSQACSLATQTSYGEEVNGQRVFTDPRLLQAYCYFLAVYGKLRSKGLLEADIRLGDSKDKNRKDLI